MWWILAALAAGGEDVEAEYDAAVEHAKVLRDAPKLAKALCDGAPEEPDARGEGERPPGAPRSGEACRERMERTLRESIGVTHDALHNELDAIEAMHRPNAKHPERLDAALARIRELLDNTWSAG